MKSLAARCLALCLLLALPVALHADGDLLPRDHRTLTEPLSYATMQALLAEADALDHIEVTVAGRTVEGRDIPLVHLTRGGAAARWRVLLHGAQHGDEHAGKDALLFMIRDFMENPDTLPETTDLWIVPMLNPDGVEADRRRNGNGADLNRDHFTLEEPETRMLHALARRLRPHLVVDCHEFGRDTRDYTEQGWTEWPQIMMDTANHTLMPDDLYRLGLEWLEDAKPMMREAGHNYCRYIVGNAPPEGEIRYSTLEADDARNGLGTLGSLSFIIESGVFRGADDPQADLGVRVDAYLHLLRPFVAPAPAKVDRAIALVEAARNEPLPRFLPTNSFWGNVGRTVTSIPVIEKATGRTVDIPMANFMHQRIVKNSVPTPVAYAVPPAAAGAMAGLLDRHGIVHSRVEAPVEVTAETCRMLRIEGETDPVYNRYDGRQIVERSKPSKVTLEPGSLLVELDQPLRVKAAIIMEPCMIYGIYEQQAYRDLIAEDGTMPVLRVMER